MSLLKNWEQSLRVTVALILELMSLCWLQMVRAFQGTKLDSNLQAAQCRQAGVFAFGWGSILQAISGVCASPEYLLLSIANICTTLTSTLQRHVAELTANLETVATLQVAPPITHHPPVEVGDLGSRPSEHDEVGNSSWGPVFATVLACGVSSNRIKGVLTIDYE